MPLYRYLKQTILAGLVLILPATIAILVALFLFQKIDSTFSPFVTSSLISLGVNLPHTYRLPGVGVVGVLFLLLFTGTIARYYLGRKFIHCSEVLLTRLPFVGDIHSAMRQLLNAFATKGQHRAFRQVVCVEYPKEGIYSIGFMSTHVPTSITRHTGVTEMAYVFIPTTPNPTSGLLIAVPREKLMVLDMSVEQGIKLVVSAGIVVPDQSK